MACASRFFERCIVNISHHLACYCPCLSHNYWFNNIINILWKLVQIMTPLCNFLRLFITSKYRVVIIRRECSVTRMIKKNCIRSKTMYVIQIYQLRLLQISLCFMVKYFGRFMKHVSGAGRNSFFHARWLTSSYFYFWMHRSADVFSTVIWSCCFFQLIYYCFIYSRFQFLKYRRIMWWLVNDELERLWKDADIECYDTIAALAC